ncbi:MAG TPA: right-handed parallel beta-helix repeat-containing protein, partial [Vicinamibacterales bacterium]|nr:right-handed parallel beta-helix repeat-containing protein [Vicinamibacterales bacterium]
VVAAGDVVYVRGGVYLQTVSIRSDGTSSARILFRSYPGETATIDGSSTAPGTVLVSFYDANYVDFTHFEIVNAKHVGISLWSSKNCTLANNTIRNSLKSGIYVGADALGQSYDNVISNNRIYNNVMENTAHTSGGTALGVNKSHRVTVIGNSVYENHGQGITYSGAGNDGLITQNTVYDNYNINIALTDTTGTRVERNLTYGSGNTVYYDNGLPPHGIGLNGTIDNVKVVNNILVDSRWGIYAYGSTVRVLNSTIANNTLHDATSRMIYIGTSTLGHSNNFVENNLFHQTTGATMATVNPGFTFRRNAWYGGSAGDAAGPGDVTVNPLLTNPGGFTALDYRLQQTSPCIDAGGLVSGVSDDYWGSTRSGAYDIGAHEFGAGTGGPKIWYVSTTGSDSNPGTYDLPFETIEKADTVVQPGDVVSVRGGTYMLAGRLTINARGTAQAPIVFRSHPGETAIIDGTNVTGVNEMLMLYRTEYVDFRDFEVRNSAKLCITGWAVKNTRFLSNKIHGCVKNAITIYHDTYGASQDVTISGNEVWDTVRENMPPSPFPNGGWAQAIMVARTVRATVTDNYIHENWGEGIVIGNSEQVYVARNRSRDNFSCLMYIERSRHVTVDGNIVWNTNMPAFYRFDDVSHGILMANEFESVFPEHILGNVTIINNIIINTRYAVGYVDIEAGGGAKNTFIANNTVYKASKTTLRMEDDDFTGSVIENNIFYQVNGWPVAQYFGTGVAFRTNAWYGSTPPANVQHSGDVLTNPMLVNPGGYTANDYKLQAGSPCIGAGTANSVTTDYWGTTRTSPWSIGAHEY